MSWRVHFILISLLRTCLLGTRKTSAFQSMLYSTGSIVWKRHFICVIPVMQRGYYCGESYIYSYLPHVLLLCSSVRVLKTMMQ